LNKSLLEQNKIRPLIWGGSQEFGLRSGSQNPGLIAAFHASAQAAYENQAQNLVQVTDLQTQLLAGLLKHGLISHGLLTQTLNPPQEGLSRFSSHSHAGLSVTHNKPVPQDSAPLTCQSSRGGSPYILSLGVPFFPAPALARLLEEQGCIVSVGSACQSKKSGPDPVLEGFGFPLQTQSSAIRISLSHQNTSEEIDLLVAALKTSTDRLSRLNPRPKTRAAGKQSEPLRK